MSFSGDRAFKGTGYTFTLLEFQPKLTINCLLLGRFSNRLSLPKLSEALKTPAGGLGEQSEESISGSASRLEHDEVLLAEVQ